MFYSFETNRNPALDLSGNGHLGVVTGAEYIAYGPGGYYRFDGVDDCIRVTNSPWLQTSNFTISAWVQSFENVYTAERGVFGKHRTGANTHSYNMYHGVYKSLYARVWGSSGSMAQMTNITATVLEKWGLLTMTYTGSTARFYVNGIPAGSATTAGHAGNTYPLLIGATELSYSLTPRLFWKGLIDEVLVYNRALDPGEITNLYSYGPNFYINRQTPITQPGGYTLDNLPNNRSYTLTVYRDSNTNGVKDAGETYFTTNQLYLSQAMTGINFLVDPDSDADGVCDAPEIYYGTDPYDSNSFPVCISGEIAYSGRQTGAVHIVVSDDAGLVLNLPFDVNGEARTYDWSGAGHTSAVYGAISTNGGYVGGTYWFDGINDYVLAGSLGYISNGVISFWMYPDVLESCRNPFSTDYAGWDDCIRFEEYSWGQFVCGKLDSAGMTYTMNLAASNWSHVVLGWNLTNLYGYFNGQHVFTTTHEGDYLDFPNVAVGNGYSYSSDRYWKGRMDEVRIYNRLLDAEGISNLYEKGFSGTESIRSQVTNGTTGAFIISNVPNLRVYSIRAWRDSDGNSSNDLYEAQGVCSNTIWAMQTCTNVNTTLQDPDTDSDAMPDWWEIQWFGSVTNWSGTDDTDEDGLSNAEEYTWNTDPTYHDTDGDGFSDLQEIQEGYDPTDIEDNPGAPLPEVNTFSSVEMGEPSPPVFGVNPYSEEEDHDRDWVTDRDERIAGTNPYDSNSVLRITNTTRTMTGMLLHWPSVTDREYKVEVYVSTNGYQTDTAFTNVFSWFDGTGGGLSYTDTASSIQVFYRLKVREKDADGDGLADWWERQYFGDLTNQTASSDPDEDGFNNADEYQLESDPNNDWSPDAPMLKVDGQYIVDDDSNRVVLKSVNIGGWLAYEQWITKFEPSIVEDQETLWNTLTNRFGQDCAENLFSNFWNCYFTTNDLSSLKNLGYNSVRVPFLYSLLEDDTNTYQYKASGWAWLDRVVENCRDQKIWCILDLHGTPGGQNAFPHSGQKSGEKNQLWDNETYKDRTEKLWHAIASRYSSNGVVCGYDLFNEPDPTGAGTKTAIYSNSIVPLITRLHCAIRSNDSNHILFLMSNFMYTNMWNDIWACPAPVAMGWTNVAYEFHHYDNAGVWDKDVTNGTMEVQKTNVDSMVRTYTSFRRERQAPVLIGEFMPLTEQNFDEYIRQFDANGIHWGNWNYRHWGWEAGALNVWSYWGLDYRAQGSNNWWKPNVQTDSYSDLQYKLSQYTWSNYSANPYLQYVVQHSIRETNSADRRTEFYLNTFSSPLTYTLTNSEAWSWQTLEVLKNNNGAGNINNGHARLFFQWGPIGLRLKSRYETDARFSVNDNTGCWLSVEPTAFSVTNNKPGADAALGLCFVQDPITNAFYAANTAGAYARLLYDKENTSVYVEVFTKTNGVNTWGTARYTNYVSAFVTNDNTAFEFFMNQSNLLVKYNNMDCWTGAHGLALSDWPNGAVCMLEAQDVATGSTWFAEFDNLKALRPGAEYDTEFVDDFTNYPAGFPVRSATKSWSLLRGWAKSRNADTYMTNGSVLWLPKEFQSGGTWLNPRRGYQQDIRLNLTATNVIELQASLNGFSTGVMKLAFMPEAFPEELYWRYQGPVIYTEIKWNGSKLVFDLVRQWQVGDTRHWVAASNNVTYVPGETVTFQLGQSSARIYYGDSLLVGKSHGTNAVTVYANGAYPHLEFQNQGSSTNATLLLDKVRARTRSAFGIP